MRGREVGRAGCGLLRGRWSADELPVLVPGPQTGAARNQLAVHVLIAAIGGARRPANELTADLEGFQTGAAWNQLAGGVLIVAIGSALCDNEGGGLGEVGGDLGLDTKATVISVRRNPEERMDTELGATKKYERIWAL